MVLGVNPLLHIPGFSCFLLGSLETHMVKQRRRTPHPSNLHPSAPLFWGKAGKRGLTREREQTRPCARGGRIRGAKASNLVHSSSGRGPCELPVSPHSNLPHRCRSSKATRSGPQLPPQHPHFPPALLRNDSCPIANWDAHSDRGAGLVRGWTCWEARKSEVLPH